MSAAVGTKIFMTRTNAAMIAARLLPCMQTQIRYELLQPLRCCRERIQTVSHSFNRDTLRQVPREIHVQPLRNSQPIRHQLKRDHIQQALQRIYRPGHLDLISLLCWELGVVLIADDDRSAFARNDLLVSVERLGEDVVAG